MIEISDSHIHIGNHDTTINTIENSIYKDKYKVYSCLNKDVLLKEKDYISKLKNFFAIPIFFKETSIQKTNDYVLVFCKENEKGIPVLCIDDNNMYKDNYSAAIFKEHFLINKSDDFRNRSLYYDFLNTNSGYLLIHCKDNLRIRYVNELLDNFKNMNIIIAHLGRDTYETYSFIDKVLESFKSNERVLFDISTIHNFNNVENALNKVGNERILYGSDFPFEVSDIKEYEVKIDTIIKTFNLETSERILNKNFERIKGKIYVRK